MPCYGALFGPQLFGHGTRVESHKSFGALRDSPKIGNGPALPRSHLESKIKVYLCKLKVTFEYINDSKAC